VETGEPLSAGSRFTLEPRGVVVFEGEPISADSRFTLEPRDVAEFEAAGSQA
jgi:hypothetical protein